MRRHSCGARALSFLVVVTTAGACNNKKATVPPVEEPPPATTGPSTASARVPARATTGVSPPAAVDLPPLPNATGKARFAMPGRAESAIEVVLPEHRPAKPPLLIAFHGTGEEPEAIVTSFDLVAKAEPLGFVAIAPRAGHRDTPHPPDVDHPADWGGSSWNMWIAGADVNEDLRYVRALIEAAKRSWNVDTTRVYAVGFSNGAYFSYFVAASMPDAIAGFAEMSGGWASDACPTRTDQDGTSLYLLATTAPPGKEIACGALLADRRVPTRCRVTATNRLRPPTPSARVPFGYLAHYSVDDSVSPVWSCLLAESLGARGKTMIRAREVDGTTGHYPMPDFTEGAWKFFAGRTNAQ